MPNTLYTQLYLNTLLLQDIASILIGGYYSNKSFRQYNDSYLLGRIQDLKRRQNIDDAKTSPIPINFRQGNKNPLTNNIQRGNSIPTSAEKISKSAKNPTAVNPNDLNLNVVYDETILNYDEYYHFLENKLDYFNEETSSRSYTIFSFYNTILSLMCNLSLVKTIDKKTENLDGLCLGDYLLLYGTLNINTVTNYVDNLINVLNSYGTITLDTSFDNSSIGPLTYTVMVKLLTTIQLELTKGNSTYVTIKLPGINTLLSLSNIYTTAGTLLYDSNGASVVVFGKISNILYDPSERISLFAKTGLPEYYQTLLKSFTPYLQVLNTNGYYVPTDYISSLSGPALQLIPVSIYI